uniref:VOC domain-containing protein n=1 Tax=Anopheles coluzzii TaxID=1518534 RepID=A0A8W7PZB6_ANOCL
MALRQRRCPMEYHYGRLLDHVHLVVADLPASKRFYTAVLQALGRELTGEGPDYFWADELFVSCGGPSSRSHGWQPAAATMASLVSVPTTMAITPPTSPTRMATISKAVFHGPHWRSAASIQVQPRSLDIAAPFTVCE